MTTTTSTTSTTSYDEFNRYVVEPGGPPAAPVPEGSVEQNLLQQAVLETAAASAGDVAAAPPKRIFAGEVPAAVVLSVSARPTWRYYPESTSESAVEAPRKMAQRGYPFFEPVASDKYVRLRWPVPVRLAAPVPSNFGKAAGGGTKKKDDSGSSTAVAATTADAAGGGGGGGVSADMIDELTAVLRTASSAASSRKAAATATSSTRPLVTSDRLLTFRMAEFYLAGPLQAPRPALGDAAAGDLTRALQALARCGCGWTTTDTAAALRAICRYCEEAPLSSSTTEGLLTCTFVPRRATFAAELRRTAITFLENHKRVVRMYTPYYWNAILANRVTVPAVAGGTTTTTAPTVDMNKIFEWRALAGLAHSQYDHGVSLTTGSTEALRLAGDLYRRSVAFQLVWLDDSAFRAKASTVRATDPAWAALAGAPAADRLAYLNRCVKRDDHHAWYTLGGVRVCCEHEEVILSGREFKQTEVRDNARVCRWCYEVVEANAPDAGAFAEGQADIAAVNAAAANTRRGARKGRGGGGSGVSKYEHRLARVLSRPVTAEDVTRYAPFLRVYEAITDAYLRQKVPAMQTVNGVVTTITALCKQIRDKLRGANEAARAKNAYAVFVKTSLEYIAKNLYGEQAFADQAFRKYMTDSLRSLFTAKDISRAFAYGAVLRNNSYIPSQVVATLTDAFVVALLEGDDTVQFNELSLEPRYLRTSVFLASSGRFGVITAPYQRAFLTDFFAVCNKATKQVYPNIIGDREIRLAFDDRPIEIDSRVLDFDRDVYEVMVHEKGGSSDAAADAADVVNTAAHSLNVDYYRMLAFLADCHPPSSDRSATVLPSRVTEHTSAVAQTQYVVYWQKTLAALTADVFKAYQSQSLTADLMQRLRVFLENPAAPLEAPAASIHDNSACEGTKGDAADVVAVSENLRRLRPACRFNKFATTGVIDKEKLGYHGTVYYATLGNGLHWTTPTIETATAAAAQAAQAVADREIVRKEGAPALLPDKTRELALYYLLALSYRAAGLLGTTESPNPDFIFAGFVADCRVRMRRAASAVARNGGGSGVVVLDLSTTTNPYDRCEIFAHEIITNISRLPPAAATEMIEWVYAELNWRTLLAVTPTDYEDYLVTTLKLIKRPNRSTRLDPDPDDVDAADAADAVEIEEVEVGADTDAAATGGDATIYDILATGADGEVEAMDDGIAGLYADDMVIADEGMY